MNIKLQYPNNIFRVIVINYWGGNIVQQTFAGRKTRQPFDPILTSKQKLYIFDNIKFSLERYFIENTYHIIRRSVEEYVENMEQI